ncbi:MAG: RiPP maturation radical SAM C-methyltransferase [Alphaproteobacteria bacterium]
MPQKPVALVSMPTLSGRFPSFQLGLLKPFLEQNGFSAQPFSLFMYFGTHVGWQMNEVLAEVWPSLIGEWIWTKAAFGDHQRDDEYFEVFERNFRTICKLAGCSLQDLHRLREDAAPRFIDFCVETVDWSRFGLVGFSLVFQQLLASIAMARALKQRYPSLPIIFGGAALEDDIAEEVLRGCPQVDYIFCGDAEISLPQVVGTILAEKQLNGVQGLMKREAGEVVFNGRAPNLRDLSVTPVPDFDEYFYARQESGYTGYNPDGDLLLPIETARGCWWGVKHHCTFCGLNRAGMEFRAKPPEQVIDMLERLSRRYGRLDFNAIDNIMAPEYAEQLFGKLAETKSDIRLHYEIRPHFKRGQLGKMRAGGLISVQPGIESLSTHILKLMKKHSTGMRNLELMKWCTYYGINNLYNILVGFAGESAEDYRLQCDVIEKIPHFQPPYAIARARADRGSPMFTDPDRHGVGNLRPSDCYRYIFPRGRFDLNKISYYFDHDGPGMLPDHEYDDIFSAVSLWQDRWNNGGRPTLTYRKACSSIFIEDSRGPDARTLDYSDRAAALYEFCLDAKTQSAIETEFGTLDWLPGALSEFRNRDLMVELDGQYLSLALPKNAYI